MTPPLPSPSGLPPFKKQTPDPSTVASSTAYDFSAQTLLTSQLSLLGLTDHPHEANNEEIESTPLFSAAVAKLGAQRGVAFPQFGLLAGRKTRMAPGSGGDGQKESDPRIFLNVNVPWSAFICGSQGSGKSHSLSCMLENCLLPNPVLGLLPQPLSALVFHYDSFTSAAGGQVSEAVYLCSSAGIDVKVLVSPTNITAMRALYANIPGCIASARPSVHPFLLSERYLNAERLMTLMAAGTASEGQMPLYMQTVLQVLRDMAREGQGKPGIDYAGFKRRVLAKCLTPGQLAPLSLRLDLLESFIDHTDDFGWGVGGKTKTKTKTKSDDWTHAPGSLTIVDLSCPFVDSDTACGLFEMCLGVFLEQKMDIGRVVVLDEAHKFMTNSTPSQKLTDSLIATIRLQRHLACRIIIATQEPTISPRLLDLCSITFVHRFSSPEWMRMLRAHLAAAAMAEGRDRGQEGRNGRGRAGQKGRGLEVTKEVGSDKGQEVAGEGESETERGADTGEETSEKEEGIFETIVSLGVGEALLFAPAAMLDVGGGGGGAGDARHGGTLLADDDDDDDDDDEMKRQTPQKLGANYLKVRIRDRLTVDGGRSKCAVVNDKL